MREGDGDRVHHAQEIDVGGVDEVGRLRITQGHGEDAGVGDDDVEPSEIGDARLERVAQLGTLTDVGLAGHDAAAQLLDGALGLREVLGRRERIVVRFDLAADVDGDDVRPLLGHADGVRPPLPPRRPGDECDLALYASSHVFLLVSVIASVSMIRSCGSRPCPSSGSGAG